MPTCPACGQAFRQRKQGACPLCKTELQQYNGQYYRASIGSPSVAFLHAFEEHVTQANKATGVNAVFMLSPKMPIYRRELSAAERLLTQYCEGDFDLAMETLSILFEHKRFSFKTRTTIGGLTNDFPLALAIARGQRLDKEKARQKAKEAVTVLDEKEDIFS